MYWPDEVRIAGCKLLRLKPGISLNAELTTESTDPNTCKCDLPPLPCGLFPHVQHRSCDTCNPCPTAIAYLPAAYAHALHAPRSTALNLMF